MFLAELPERFGTFLFVFQPNPVIVAKDGKQKTLKFSNLLVRNVVVNLKERVVSPIFTISMVASEPRGNAAFLKLIKAGSPM